LGTGEAQGGSLLGPLKQGCQSQGLVGRWSPEAPVLTSLCLSFLICKTVISPPVLSWERCRAGASHKSLPGTP
jgi:hypothetical protein